MPIPDYQTIMLPLLEFASDGKAHSIDECTEQLARHFELTPQEKRELIPSGRMTYIKNRTGWARTYLKEARLLDSPKRGEVQITDRGMDVLAKLPLRIDQELLKQFPEFVDFLNRSRRERTLDLKSSLPSLGNEKTPEEAIEDGYQQVRVKLADELLENVRKCSPHFFEKIVVDLLVSMGYGGSLKDAGQATQQSGDGGIDGIIKEDRLGLDTIYIQAKRWENTVHRPEIQKFAGALQGVRAKKGIFITTSTFSEGASQFAAGIESKLVLIDGEQLAQYMIDFNVGTSVQQVYEVKKIDSDYFVEG